MITISLVPVLLVLIPMLGTGAIYFAARYGDRWRSRVVNGVALLTSLISVYQFWLAQGGSVLCYEFEWVMAFGLRWRVDFVGAVFSVVISAVWLLATVFAGEYMAHEHKQTRFFAYSIFTLGSTLGVFVAGDLFSLFLFFELMTLAAYLLVIHEEDPDSMRAGNVYLYMSIAGGLSLLGVIFLLQYLTGSTEFVPALHRMVEAGINPWWVLIMVILGFGVKAGMLPLHIWLPKAHPVAPAPASALLSAIMIKAGAYGFLRFLFVILTAPDGDALFSYQQSFGYVFVWIGAVTMFIGAIMGILNYSMKKVLAYSSISQMGYILFAVGAGVMLGSRGAVGFAGAWMHMINHAFFKSFLFLLAGAVFIQTRELDLNKLGGLRTKMPWAFGFFLIAASAITGVPGFNGYVSKILIHESILEAYHLLHWPSLLWLERIFVITGGLTAAYISKIWIKTFLGKPQEKWGNVQDISWTHKGVFAVYTIIIVGIGVFAQRRVDQLVVPALSLFPFAKSDIEHLAHVPFWGAHELQSPITSYLIAAVALFIMWKFGKYLVRLKWISVEYLVYEPLMRLARSCLVGLSYLGTTYIPQTLARWQRFVKRAVLSGKKLNRKFDRRMSSLKNSGTVVADLRIRLVKSMKPKRYITMGDLLDKLEESWHTVKNDVVVLRHKEQKAVKDIAQQIQVRNKQRKRSFWTTANLGFDTWIIAVVIAVLLFVFLFFSL